MRMETEPPFKGTSRIIVLNAIADEVADLPGIHLDRDLDPQLPLGRDHERPHVVGQIKLLGGLVKIEVRGLKGLHRVHDPGLIDRYKDQTLRNDRNVTGMTPAMGREHPGSLTSLRKLTCTMTRPWILSELNYGQVKSNATVRVAVLPLGATEPHNLHLPYGTDT